MPVLYCVYSAMELIDKNGIPSNFQKSTHYIFCNGRRYPLSYTIDIACKNKGGAGFEPYLIPDEELMSFVESLGFQIAPPKEKYELTITADNVSSTDYRFTKDNLGLGDNYKTLDVYFQKSNGEIIRRIYNKGERKNTNKTIPRLACQIFEKQISSLSVEDKEAFPICQYNPKTKMICGIFTSLAEFKRQRKNSIEFANYAYGDGREFVVYCWNLFSTIIFVQECLKRFGQPGDAFVIIYREKEEKEAEQEAAEKAVQEELVQEFKGYRNPYSSMLIESKNIIFRGAPGTGKSYLAKEIAADIISDGYFDDYTLLTDEQKKQVEFVQFHPSYDYSDFVEGLRPQVNSDGSMGFTLQDGVFKKFIARARKNYESSQKSLETIKKELSVQDAMADFFDSIEFGIDKFQTINGNEFTVTSADDQHIYIFIPNNPAVKKLCLNADEIRRMLESGESFSKIKDITHFFGKQYATQGYSYNFALYNAIKAKMGSSAKLSAKPEELKKFIFIIDEINRGEISKIFGELFFAIDPGYRGRSGEVSTQYANLHPPTEGKFFIPENVYIIGTMNDIDRSVDSFDFAMRRRFRFIEIKADTRLEMLALLDDETLEAEAIKRMTALNNEIVKVDELNENYQIGASYFLKLKTLTFDQLWTDYLQPLLHDYVQGMYDEATIMSKFAKAYGYQEPKNGNDNETDQDQG